MFFPFLTFKKRTHRKIKLVLKRSWLNWLWLNFKNKNLIFRHGKDQLYIISKVTLFFITLKLSSLDAIPQLQTIAISKVIFYYVGF